MLQSAFVVQFLVNQQHRRQQYASGPTPRQQENSLTSWRVVLGGAALRAAANSRFTRMSTIVIARNSLLLVAGFGSDRGSIGPSLILTARGPETCNRGWPAVVPTPAGKHLNRPRTIGRDRSGALTRFARFGTETRQASCRGAGIRYRPRLSRRGGIEWHTVEIMS